MRQLEYRTNLICSLFLAAFFSILTGCQRDASLSTQEEPKKVRLAARGEPAVELVIDFGDGAEKRFTGIPFEEGMTILAALQFAADHPRGITFEKSGSGEAALLTKIDDLANQAGDGDKNWIYRVNGELASKSFDAYVLAPGDVILWRFEAYK